MRNLIPLFVVALVTAALMHVANAAPEEKKSEEQKKVEAMKLGNFSVSLAVKDIHKSKAFYEKLGFKTVAGVIKQNWIVLQNETTTIGLFQGMFPKNLMTFNPGWDHNKKTLKGFMDVREIQARLEKSGIKLTSRADPASTGPASFMIADPDGNTLLFDQHVPAPGKSE